MLKDDLKFDSEAASEFLTDAQLDLVSGGLLMGPVWEVPGAPDPTVPVRPGIFV